MPTAFNSEGSSFAVHSIQLEIVDFTVLLRKDIFGEDGLVQFSQDLKSAIGDSSQFFEDMIKKSKLNK